MYDLKDPKLHTNTDIKIDIQNTENVNSKNECLENNFHDLTFFV